MCDLEFTHHTVARSHYSGKPHMKNLNKSLEKWFAEDPGNRKMPTKKHSDVTSTSNEVCFVPILIS